MYDLFVGELRCPTCGVTTLAGEHTAMQTHLRIDADGSALGVGFELDPVDLKTEKILRCGYLLVARPEPGKPIRLLETWTCPRDDSDQWAMVTIDQGRIQSIEAVILDRATLQTSNFISDCAGVVETLRRNLT